MTIYGKSLYNVRKKKPKGRKISITGTTAKDKVNMAMDKFYGTAKKKECQKCGEMIFMIKGRSHEIESDEIGLHARHACKRIRQ